MKIGDKVNLKSFNEVRDHWAIPDSTWDDIAEHNPHIIVKVTTTNLKGINGIIINCCSYYAFPETAFTLGKNYHLEDDLFEI